MLVMCGRYTLIRLADFTDMFPWIRSPETDVPPRYNIAPTQLIAAVPNDGENQVEFFHWGLIPSWAKDSSIGSRLINARAETISTKPAFRAALKRRRCLIPASGFYEWKKNPDGKTKTPMYIHPPDGKPVAFAGLWEVWHAPDGSEVRSCAIITGEPNELVAPIHDRMPVILDPDCYKRWLTSGEIESDKLSDCIKPYSASKLQVHPVSKRVNSPANDVSECIEPWDEGPVSEKKPVRKRKKADDQPRLF
jgi:putative SOS response-associated peptidase YedK